MKNRIYTTDEKAAIEEQQHRKETMFKKIGPTEGMRPGEISLIMSGKKREEQ